MILAISLHSSWSNFYLNFIFEKLVLYVLLVFFIRAFWLSAIHLVSYCFLAAFLVAIMFDFQI